MNCPACGACLTPRQSALHDEATAANYDLLGCNTCGHAITAPLPPDLGAAYTLDYHGGRHGFSARLCFERRFSRIAAALPLGVPRRLLDIGCGDGSQLLLAQQRGFEVAGTEFSCEAARARGLDVRRNVTEFASTAPFGVITLWHSLEHMQDPVALLRQAHNLLHPQGVLLLAVPDARSVSARVFGRHWLHLDLPRHLHHFSRHSLQRVLQQAGYAPLRRFGGEAEYDLIAWAQGLLDKLGLPEGAFLKALMGKSKQGLLLRALHGALGCCATALALLPWAVCAALRSPGTLVVAARRA